MKGKKKLKFKCKAKIVEAVEKNLVFQAPIRVEKQTFQHKVAKTRKLKFKKTKEMNTTQSNVPLIDAEYEYNNETSQKNQNKKKTSIPKRVHQIPEIHEYGPEIDGYRYIAFNKEEIPSLKEDVSSSELTNSDIEDSENHTDDTINSPFETYLLQWQKIIHGGKVESVPLPVHSGLFKDVNLENVRRFLYSKSIAKLERIRWHPDKMRILLKDNEKLEDREITHVFQTINTVYENWDMPFKTPA